MPHSLWQVQGFLLLGPTASSRYRSLVSTSETGYGAHVAVSGTCRILFSWGPCRSFRHVQDSFLLGPMSLFQAGAGFFSPGAHIAVSSMCRILFSWGACRRFRYVQDSFLLGPMSQFQARAGFFSPGAQVAVSGTCRILFSWGPCRSFRHVQDSFLLWPVRCFRHVQDSFLLGPMSQFQAGAGLLSPRHRPAMGPTQLLLQCEVWAVTTGLKWPCREADHLFLSSAKVNMRGA